MVRDYKNYGSRVTRSFASWESASHTNTALLVELGLVNLLLVVDELDGSYNIERKKNA